MSRNVLARPARRVARHAVALCALLPAAAFAQVTYTRADRLLSLEHVATHLGRLGSAAMAAGRKSILVPQQDGGTARSSCSSIRCEVHAPRSSITRGSPRRCRWRTTRATIPRACHSARSSSRTTERTSTRSSSPRASGGSSATSRRYRCTVHDTLPSDVPSCCRRTRSRGVHSQVQCLCPAARGVCSRHPGSAAR